MFQKKKVIVEPINKLTDLEKPRDIWIAFAPLKKDKTDFLIEKCKVPFIKVASMGFNGNIRRHLNLETVSKPCLASLFKEFSRKATKAP